MENNFVLPAKKISIPDNWNDVTDFMNWYMDNNMPIQFATGEVFCSDDATSICLFRKGHFQVELYLIHPEPLVQLHEHPGVEVIKMEVKPDSIICSDVLLNKESHGLGFRNKAQDKGFPLIAFQYWKDGNPTTVAAAWKGKTAGPKHDALIKRFYPNALLLEGYADITKTMDYLETLKETMK